MKAVSFYHFFDLQDPQGFCAELRGMCGRCGLLGTILVATEGFNGTVAGDEADILALFEWLRERAGLGEELDARWTDVDTAPFRRLRVKVKKEIVTLGRPDISPHKSTGKHVPPEHWNALLDNPDVLLVDTRNHYEIEVGTFPGALDPGNDSFRQFPKFASELAETSRDRPVAMFCTGGIRCEKATALMLELGFNEVYQLQGGILNYLQRVPADENRWAGECFVFDTRVALDRDLAEGGYAQCHACRRPLSAADLQSAQYREGVSCPQCINETDDDRRARLEERRRQVALAASRGDRHIGPKNPRNSLHATGKASRKTV